MISRGQTRTRPNRTRRKAGRKRLNYTTALFLIFAVEAVALGLKAYDDRKRTEIAEREVLHREAVAVSQFVSGRVDTTLQALVFAHRSGWTPRQTAAEHDDIDAVISLADALSAPEGTRLNQAGETASRILAEDQVSGLSAAGDIVIAYNPGDAAARMALIRAEAWTPQATPEHGFSLVPGRVNGLRDGSETTYLACSALAASAMSACIETARPKFGQADIINLLIYAMLLLGPALAILGLLRMLEERRDQSEAFEGQATRAGRILATVLQEAKAGFWSWDTRSDQVWLSQEAAVMFGINGAGFYSFGELDDLVFPDHLAAVRQALETLPKRGFISQPFATADKSRWIDMRGRPDELTGEINGIVLDITEMRAAIARTKQAELRLKSALEGFSGPFALWDKRKRIVYWNRAFARVFGLENSIRVGMGHDTVSLSQASSILEQRKTKDSKGAEVIRVRTGEWYKVVERQTPSGGMITMGLDVSSDVQNELELTNQQNRLRKLVQELERSESRAGELARKLNEEKLKAERSANSKSAFLANMSHELRTPLNAINGFSEILTQQMYGPLGDERYVNYASDILASGQHLLDMINDILDMAKIEAGKMTVDLQPIDLVDPVDAAIRMVRRKAEDKGISLKLVANDDLPLVDADHRAIRQMILNLVSNAIKFTDDGGEIRVTIDRKDEMLRVAVRDTGVGIPADALPRLAQPFEQVSDTRDRNYDGTGLGLALTKSFAEMHGGHLTIASEEGRGTQVSFFLPISNAGSVDISDVA